MKQNYDWRILSFVQSATKLMSEGLDRSLIASTNSTDKNARTAFAKLDTRLHLCMGQLQNILVGKSTGGAAKLSDTLLGTIQKHGDASKEILTMCEAKVEDPALLTQHRQKVEE